MGIVENLAPKVLPVNLSGIEAPKSTLGTSVSPKALMRANENIALAPIISTTSQKIASIISGPQAAANDNSAPVAVAA